MSTDRIVDHLYGLPREAFTTARNAAADELRKAGKRGAADRIKALRKPTSGAAAANRLVREHRDEVEAFLKAASELRDAQLSGKGDLMAATRRERSALDRISRRR